MQCEQWCKAAKPALLTFCLLFWFYPMVVPVRSSMYFQTRHGNLSMWTNLFHVFSTPLTKRRLSSHKASQAEMFYTEQSKIRLFPMNYSLHPLWYSCQTVQLQMMTRLFRHTKTAPKWHKNKCKLWITTCSMVRMVYPKLVLCLTRSKSNSNENKHGDKNNRYAEFTNYTFLFVSIRKLVLCLTTPLCVKNLVMLVLA